ILDDDGQVVTRSKALVTLSLKANPGAATLGGTLTAAAVNGIATFSDLSLDKAGDGYVLLASSGSLPPVASGPFAVAAKMAPDLQVTNLSVSPSDLQSGSALLVAWDDANAGNLAASGAWADRVRIVNKATGEELASVPVLHDPAAGSDPIEPGAA